MEMLNDKTDYTEIYQSLEKKFQEERMPWEPNSVSEKFFAFGTSHNKYTKKAKENLTLICMLCGNTDTVSKLFHVPEPTLKTWLYKVKKMNPNYRYEWYPLILDFDLNTKIKILFDFYLKMRLMFHI